MSHSYKLSNAAFAVLATVAVVLALALRLAHGAAAPPIDPPVAEAVLTPPGQ